MASRGFAPFGMEFKSGAPGCTLSCRRWARRALETTEGKEPTATIWHISEIQVFEDGLVISVSFHVRLV